MSWWDDVTNFVEDVGQSIGEAEVSWTNTLIGSIEIGVLAVTYIPTQVALAVFSDQAGLEKYVDIWQNAWDKFTQASRDITNVVDTATEQAMDKGAGDWAQNVGYWFAETLDANTISLDWITAAVVIFTFFNPWFYFFITPFNEGIVEWASAEAGEPSTYEIYDVQPWESLLTLSPWLPGSNEWDMVMPGGELFSSTGILEPYTLCVGGQPKVDNVGGTLIRSLDYYMIGDQSLVYPGAGD